MPPAVRATSARAFLLCLLLAECCLEAVSERLRCYSCKSMAGLPHSADCMDINELTNTAQCPTTARFCKKRVARQENYTVIERTCEEKCLEQTGIKMMSGVILDTYCCQTDLCNAAQSWIRPRPVIVILIASLLSWITIQNAY